MFERGFYNSLYERLFYKEESMMSKIKNYFKDFVIAQKACNEFYKKHWLGTLVFTAMIYVVTIGGLFAEGRIKKKEHKLNKKNLDKK